MPTQPIEEQKTEDLLGKIKTKYYEKALENYLCYLSENENRRYNTKISRLYYALYLACKGNLFINRQYGPNENIDEKNGRPDEWINHHEIHVKINQKYPSDKELQTRLVYYPTVVDLRHRADYYRRHVSMDRSDIQTVLKAEELIKLISERSYKEKYEQPQS